MIGQGGCSCQFNSIVAFLQTLQASLNKDVWVEHLVTAANKL